MTVVIFMICCVIVLETMQVAALNAKICFWDQCSLQADQAAQAGLAWARCQLDAIPPDDTAWAPSGNLVLDNGAQASVSCTMITGETGVEYVVTSSGLFQGAKCNVKKSFFVPLPVSENP